MAAHVRVMRTPLQRPLAHPRHRSHKVVLRTFGVLLALLGALFFGLGVIGTFVGGNHGLFLFAMVGLPMLGVGLMMLKAGYLGAISRYVAAETTPVATDALSHLAHGTTDAVQATAAAIGKGLRGDAPVHRC